MNYILGDKCRSCRFDKCLIEGMDPLMIKIDDMNSRNEFIETLEKRRNKLQEPSMKNFYLQEDEKPNRVKNNKNFNQYQQSSSNQNNCISNELYSNSTTIGSIFLNILTMKWTKSGIPGRKFLEFLSFKIRDYFKRVSII